MWTIEFHRQSLLRRCLLNLFPFLIDVSTFMLAGCTVGFGWCSVREVHISVAARVIPLDFFYRNLMHMNEFIANLGDKLVLTPWIHATQSIAKKTTTDLIEEDFAHFCYPYTIVTDYAAKYRLRYFKCTTRSEVSFISCALLIIPQEMEPQNDWYKRTSRLHGNHWNRLEKLL